MGYKRNAETQKRLKQKYNGRYRTPIYFDEEKGIWRRCTFGKANAKGCRAYYKKQSHRVIRRRDKDTSCSKGGYHKLYDFWWNLL